MQVRRTAQGARREEKNREMCKEGEQEKVNGSTL